VAAPQIELLKKMLVIGYSSVANRRPHTRKSGGRTLHLLRVLGTEDEMRGPAVKWGFVYACISFITLAAFPGAYFTRCFKGILVFFFHFYHFSSFFLLLKIMVDLGFL
jgi:hypothetical protein